MLTSNNRRSSSGHSRAHEWSLHVIADLETYFFQNELPAVAQELRGTYEVVAAMLATETSKVSVPQLRSRYSRFPS